MKGGVRSRKGALLAGKSQLGSSSSDQSGFISASSGGREGPTCRECGTGELPHCRVSFRDWLPFLTLPLFLRECYFCVDIILDQLDKNLFEKVWVLNQYQGSIVIINLSSGKPVDFRIN